MRSIRRLPAWILACALWLLSAPAHAWTDARPSGLVTEISIDRDGGATVTLRVRWRVLAGRLRQFELVDLPTDLALLEAIATNASGAPVALSTHAPGPGRLEVSLGDEQGGVRRGAVDVVIRYTTSFRALGAIQRAGADAVIDVATVPWERGLEAAEIRIALPTGARRAQWIADDTPGVDATTTTELSRDVVHALRRHVPAGTRWTARIAADANLFPWLAAGAHRSNHTVRRARPSPMPSVGLALGLSLALIVIGTWLSRSTRRPLLPLPERMVPLPVVLTVLGAVLQSLTLLDVSIALPAGTAMLLTAVSLRIPRPRALVLASATEEFRKVSELSLRAGISRRPWRPLAGFVALLGVSVAVGALGLRHHSLLLDVIALDVTLVAIAVLALRHRTGAPMDAEVLLPVAHRAQKIASKQGRSRIAWRVRGDEHHTGAVRARLVPKPGVRLARGLRSIEWAVSMHAGTFGWRPTAVAMLRADAGSLLDRELRALAERAGAMIQSPNADETAYTVELIGPDASAFFSALPTLLDKGFVSAPETLKVAVAEAP